MNGDRRGRAADRLQGDNWYPVIARAYDL